MTDTVITVRDDQKFLFRLQLGNILNTPEQRSQIARPIADLHFTALNLGNIQNIVDQGQQIVTGRADLIQRVRNRFRFVLIGFGNVRISHDGIHRRTDVMGHIGKKIISGAGARFPDAPLVLRFAFHLRFNIVGPDDQMPPVFVLQQRGFHADPDRGISKHQPVFHGKNFVTLQDGHDFFPVKRSHEAFPVVFVYQPRHIPPAQIEKIFAVFFYSQRVEFFCGRVFDKMIRIQIYHVDTEIIPGQRRGHTPKGDAGMVRHFKGFHSFHLFIHAADADYDMASFLFNHARDLQLNVCGYSIKHQAEGKLVNAVRVKLRNDFFFYESIQEPFLIFRIYD